MYKSDKSDKYGEVKSYQLSSTPPHLRIDRSVFDRLSSDANSDSEESGVPDYRGHVSDRPERVRGEPTGPDSSEGRTPCPTPRPPPLPRLDDIELPAPVAHEVASVREFARPAPLSGKERREAMVCLAGLLPDIGVRASELTSAQLRAVLDCIPDSGVPWQSRAPARPPRKPIESTERMRMWAGCGLLPPHVRKKLPIGVAAYISRVCDIIKHSSRACCDWAVATVCRGAGVDERTGQRGNALIAAGKIPGLSIKRPVNRGINTSTNIITFTFNRLSGKRLHKWVERNFWGGRLYSHTQERICYQDGDKQVADPQYRFEVKPSYG